jgi:hypothetical protein
MIFCQKATLERFAAVWWKGASLRPLGPLNRQKR